MMVRHRCRRRPPTLVLGGLTLSFAALLTFYLSLNLPIDKDNVSHNVYVDKNEVASLESRLHKLENAQMVNRNAINKLVDIVAKMRTNDGSSRGLEPIHISNWLDQDVAFTSNWSEVISPSCGVAQSPPAKTDVQMLELYDKIDFLNTDGGVWKQGWKLEYNENQWDSDKLKVFVVPHSHNDPGWVKTFDKYYQDHTQHIFNNMIDKLGENTERKFIWAEISYLSYWWDKVDDKKRNSFKKYLETGQLEIVTGGWVMTDEASSHYYAMLEQLIEGQQWVKNHLDYVPQNGWAIDPFGLSSTMAYLLKRTNMSHMVVQRVHYSVKKELASQKSCEFHWRQLWDQGNSTDIVCHVMPFYSYDVPHSCGPDPMVCCQFDFKRLPGGKVTCPWKKPPIPITDKNVAERAQTLLDQYRKKSLLFRTNVVMIPLGDDFRYDKGIEWDQQFSNYQKLFDHMNSQPTWNVKAKFGTLKDYFAAVEEELSLGPATEDRRLPSLSGDFFTYADREDHYWSGYFSSRPVYKNMDRYLEYYLRAGEIVFSLALARASFRGVGEVDLAREILPKIVSARRNLSLFQHHDAITGTAKDPVVVDYANRLLTSIRDMQLVIGRSVAFLTSPEGTPYSSDFQAVAFDLDDHRASYFALPRKSLVEIPRDGRTVVFYNSLAQRRRESVSLFVSSSKVCVNDANGAIVMAQLIPLWETESISIGQYELVFNVDVAALGSALYRIVPSDKLSLWKDCVSISTVKVFNSVREPASHPVFKVEGGATSSFQLTNSHVVASFSEDGLLEGMGMKQDGLSIQAKLGFFKYGTRNSKDKSGAYLFLPGDPATPIVFQKPYYRVIEGPLLSEVQLFLPNVAHKVQLKNSAGIDGFGIDILNVVNISRELNKELVMRFETSVDSGNEFFTDLNGFQIVKRKMFSKIPIQGNFYPIPTMAFIQDEHNRFTLITGQPLGGTSLNSGWLEIVLDRRLGQDDNRGLGQGILDNKQTLSSFRLLLEKRMSSNNLQSTSMGFPSLVGNLATNTLLHPVLRLIASATSPGAPMPPIVPLYRPLRTDLPCDMHIVNLRTLMTETDGEEVKTFTLQEATALVLHRHGFDCQIATPDLGCQLTDGKITIGEHLADYFKDTVTTTSLTLLHDAANFSKSDSQQRLSAMELQAYKLYR